MPRKKPKYLVADAAKKTKEISLERAQADIRSWKRRHSDATKTILSLEEQLDVIIGLQSDVQHAPFKRKRSPAGRGVAAIIPATDWHTEERITLEAVNGKNEFNLAVAERRIKRFYNGALEMIEWQNHRKKVVEIWHPLLGDLITGHIHEELLETNTLSPTEACLFVSEMVCSGIDLWLKETGLPIFIPTCCGNHGRTTPKKRIKTSCRNSFEWMLYMTMAKYYKFNPRVHWMVGQSEFNIQTVMGRKVRFHHGDCFKGGGGIGGVTVPINRGVASLQKIDTCDFDIFGHFHAFLYHFPSWVCCPSLIGYSEFAYSIRAEFQHPAQAFIVIDRDYGITLATLITLEDPWRKTQK